MDPTIASKRRLPMKVKVFCSSCTRQLDVKSIEAWNDWWIVEVEPCSLCIEDKVEETLKQWRKKYGNPT